MHWDDGQPIPLEPISRDELDTVYLVESFAFQAGDAVTASREPGVQIGMAQIVLMHLAMRRNRATERSVQVVAFDSDHLLGLVAASVEMAATLYGPRAAAAIQGGLDAAAEHRGQ